MAAFRATLEEIAEADVLLHVVDITHPLAAAQVRSVEETLRDIGASDKPTVMALNKIDEHVEPNPVAGWLPKTSWETETVSAYPLERGRGSSNCAPGWNKF